MIDASISPSVPRRLQALRTASFRMERRVFTRISPTCPWCRGNRFEGDATVEMAGQTMVVADEDEGCTGSGGFLQQQVDEGLLAFGIECRGGFVGDDDFRPADQCAGRGNALLLPDAEASSGLVPSERSRSSCASRRSASRRRTRRIVCALRRAEKAHGRSTLSSAGSQGAAG